jgi:glycosyltransferase involved in cell wall biosynthesis
MKIALSALQQRHFLTGTGRYIAELYRHLPRIAPEHEFALYTKTDQQGLFVADGANHRVRVLPQCPISPTKRSLWELVKFASVLRADGVGLYHGPANFLPPRKVCPYVLTLHDMFFFRNPERTGFVRSQYWRQTLRATWRHADVIITDSEFSRSEITRFLPVPQDRIRVIPLGVDEAFLTDMPTTLRTEMRASLKLDLPYALYVGRLDPDKNVRRVVEAFAAEKDTSCRGHLLAIAGAKDFQSSGITDLVASLGITDRVRLLGYVEERHLVALYQECAVLCYPSLNEGFGLPPLEGMAAGVPVVTSNVSSLPEVVGDAAIQVDPFSVSAIAAGIASALDPVRGVELREAGRARARTFTWERTARMTLDCYKEALARG